MDWWKVCSSFEKKFLNLKRVVSDSGINLKELYIFTMGIKPWLREIQYQ